MFKLTICYQTVTPESASRGDFASTGIGDTLEFDSIQEIAEYITDNYGGIEPSSSQFHKGIWYTEIDPEVDLYTAEETSHTFHIEGATREQEVELYNLLMKRS